MLLRSTIGEQSFVFLCTLDWCMRLVPKRGEHPMLATKVTFRSTNDFCAASFTTQYCPASSTHRMPIFQLLLLSFSHIFANPIQVHLCVVMHAENRGVFCLVRLVIAAANLFSTRTHQAISGAPLLRSRRVRRIQTGQHSVLMHCANCVGRKTLSPHIRLSGSPLAPFGRLRPSLGKTDR